ncbi:MAG: hypothetical protein QXW01_00995 [Candidatus Aenigmatarchaeota archaeon]
MKEKCDKYLFLNELFYLNKDKFENAIEIIRNEIANKEYYVNFENGSLENLKNCIEYYPVGGTLSCIYFKILEKNKNLGINKLDLYTIEIVPKNLYGKLMYILKV